VAIKRLEGVGSKGLFRLSLVHRATAIDMLYFLYSEPAMIDEIALHREELRELCRRYHVLRLDLIGSAARDDFDPERSDVDFLVEFDRAHPKAMSFDTYFGLKESLEKLLGKRVDLVESSAVRNPYLKAEFERSRVALFEA
jgi:predicted nucleotidyltransferase